MGRRPQQWGRFSSTPGLYPVGTSSNPPNPAPVITKNVSRHCQMSPGGGGTVDPGENYSVQCFGESVSRGWCKPLDSLRCSEGQCGVRAERPALSVPQLQWGTTSRDHQTHQEGGTGGRKEGQAQKKADQGVVCYPHLPLFTCHEHHLSAWTLWPGRDRRV